MEPFLLGAAGIVLNPLIRATMKAAGACLKKDSLASFGVEAIADIFGDLAGSAAESTLTSLQRDGNFHLESALANAMATALKFARQEFPHSSLIHADVTGVFDIWQQSLADTTPGTRESLFYSTDLVDRAYLHTLRDPKHGKAWIAYQQRYLETIAAGVRADHGDLADRIEALALDMSEMKNAVLAELEWQTERVMTAIAGVDGRVVALDEKVEKALNRLRTPAAPPPTSPPSPAQSNIHPR